METKNLRTMARETAELALQLAALPAEGRVEIQVLNDLEQLAARIMMEASMARAAVRVVESKGIGESRGMWRIVQPLRP
jgi:hypothetical protein